ncbi:hypothetical protein CEP54_016015 [Fusarium duplospermum]|uniref:Uncharacterized protein n=1 Tax=Fusarium duplospermum TaxID=1325734 RepID=A0A428NJ33_9HYPO|nr:hypothetical protein CEP54_016015 [Fusarium duplospermum]
MSFNCSVLLLLYKNTLQPQEEQFIRNEQRLLDNLAQKLARHGEPTTTESRKPVWWRRLAVSYRNPSQQSFLSTTHIGRQHAF